MKLPKYFCKVFIEFDGPNKHEFPTRNSEKKPEGAFGQGLVYNVYLCFWEGKSSTYVPFSGRQAINTI